ncbi:EAL domain-containing protein [Metabacillus fastidiosus]|uniref:putative bifunctional diguanylate cyclase/phosphodiesterase n=1 Tax=Metabacillus fastidiosus TaxID=1458 RepID=UPI003D2DDF8D
MSIKKKLPLIFTLLVLCILIANNTLQYIRSKQELINYNEREIQLITQEIAIQVENSKKGALYVEDIRGRELRTASIAIKNSLPKEYKDVTNEQLKALADELMISHITLLGKTEDDIIGVKSSDPAEINMSTKSWTFWYDAFEQLFALSPVTVQEGLYLPNYWTGPVEVSSSNPDHTDKWGYFYDGTTDFIINPYLRDNEVLQYEKNFGPSGVMDRFTETLDGVLELTVFNPKNFGEKEEITRNNGNSLIRIADQPIWYGTYKYQNEKMDKKMIQKAMRAGEAQNYIETINGKNVKKTFVPIRTNVNESFVIGVTYNYGLIQKQLHDELWKHLLLLIPFILVVLITSFGFSRSITKPISFIVEQVNEIAQGNFGKKLVLKRRDELGCLTENVNSLSRFLQTYVADLRKSQEFIEFQAYHDSLTGLPNRRYLQEELARMIESIEQTDSTLAVLFIDIDRFKDVNDSLGHAMGDQLIREVANRIKGCLPEQNSVLTRQGGDEFVILFKNLMSEEIKTVTEMIVTVMKQPFFMEGTEVYVGASGGLSVYPKDSKDLDALMVYADIAMYAAKKQGGSRVVLYNEQINSENKEKIKIETRLRKAIQDNTIEVYYQPKVNAKENIMTGVEALLRWTDEELGVVAPNKFIPIAEENGLIYSLWELVMKQACSDVSNWNKKRPEPLTLAVNFSAKQFQDPARLVNQVITILSKSNLSPEYFDLEITESTLFDHLDEAIEVLKELRNYGITVSVDDFGTGYSSLSYLKILPIDNLKIDRTFIQNIKEDHTNSEIPEAIIAMARGLQLDVIAEGVEEEYQKEFLIKNGSYHMQGYLFSKPLSKEEFEKKFGEII